MTNTRVVRLRPGLLREPERNWHTRLDRPRPRGPLDAAALFESRYRGVREAWRRHERQGIIVFAFDDRDDPVAELWLEASLDRTRTAIVGRHSLCDLLIPPEHADVSLRHLVILTRAISHEEVRTRVIDLATGLAFSDEAGRTLHAVSADGPMFLRVGGLDLMILSTPESEVLPEDPREAYQFLPERVFFDEREGRAEARPRHLIGGVAQAEEDREQTAVRAWKGPVMSAKELCGEDEAPAGTLIIRSGGAVARRTVGESALERGILIGRYPRCDLGGADDGSVELSRVHVLIVRDGSDVMMVDTASTNGTMIGGKMRKAVALQDGDVMKLSGELELVWMS